MTKRHLNSGSLGPRVGIAWQGGANHGAFSWGVARALLSELERREIPLVGMIGASAGAKNAVYAAQGWLTGEIGHKAIQADLMLERLWFSVAEMAAPLAATMQMGNPLTAMGTATDQFGAMMGRTVGILGALASGFLGVAAPSAELETQLPAFEYAGLTARHGAFLSAATNDPHPLRHLVGRQIDFDLLAQAKSPVLMVATTNLNSGCLNIHTGRGLTAEALASSATLPELFSPLHIDDSLHWDGGFSANPPLQPLYLACPDMTDLVVIRVTPQALRTGKEPASGDFAAINDRRMEILLNASVEAELRTLPALAQAQGRMLNLHVISVPPDWPHSMESMTDVRNTNWAYFKSLRDEGQRAGEAWVHEHGMDLGQRSSYVSGYRVFDGKAATHPMSHIPRLSAA